MPLKKTTKTGVDKILSAISSSSDMDGLQFVYPEYWTKENPPSKSGYELLEFYTGEPSEAEKRGDKAIDEFQRKHRLQYERRQAEKLMDPESRKFFADESRPSYQSPERRLRDRRKE